MATKRITADELFEMGDIGRCELVHGELIMMSPASFGHGEIIVRITRFLAEHVEAHDLGSVLAAETGFEIEEDTVRAPDVGFVAKARLPKKFLEKFYPGVPDLAVEVLSPSDRKREVVEKTNMWLANGTAVVWIVDPKAMTVAVHRVGEKPLVLTGNDVLTENKLLNNFELPLSKIFKRP